ncbi:glycosyltransferase family 9 protein [Pseudoalteromonas sp. McH1-7]|uniref:Heptosyltransferase I n=1 Tax=Pseudoalteromonas peptidolytica F12-50-A1 TaxID=1315280 RepID=A0A8I0T3M8_9GAMM|nr:MULTISPECIES: glycosyltransferase family 9 protein [Pseudoalteromonas]MBE0345273.1 heptosyltransferase I [Pseudoalteromonas peptidolytica F12-50-A1]MDW7547370.1 glycosyltransferase family 9 protein [Pseudoalteromonas peptidolytica]NLR16881.1 glycosyltransferase family 9 protein [Pseudoalteromonas peptidolytica]NUZ12554.1 glycosyltransferase family 9 protein [Pseudoalteromonas sp. McH1-7]USD27976.1 glycosyltransferase family 9 protein [Pseudoalteromonas sp. SCSIO 43201]
MRANILSNSLSSICILRLSAIGDVCHAVSAVQAIQRAHPQAKITWVIGKVEAMLLAGLPGVELVVFDKKQGKAALKALKAKFKGQKFDVLLHMQVALRANLVARVIPAKQKIGFDKGRSKELHSLFINKRIAAQQSPHVLEGFQNFARAIGAECAKPSWNMPVTDDHKASAKALLPEGKIFVISPAASKAERNWLPERYAALADHAMKSGFNVVITGGPTELEQNLAADIQKHTQSALLNLVGKTDLKTLLCILDQADVVLAPDTGPAHMAVTVNTPVIGLYAHSNPKRTGPYLYQDYVVEVYHKNLVAQKGKTADELPWGTRVKGRELMSQIEVADVIAMFDRVVKEQELNS